MNSGTVLEISGQLLGWRAAARKTCGRGGLDWLLPLFPSLWRWHRDLQTQQAVSFSFFLSFFLSVVFLSSADLAVGSRSRSSTWGWTGEGEQVDEEGDGVCGGGAGGKRRTDRGLWAPLAVWAALGLVSVEAGLCWWGKICCGQRWGKRREPVGCWISGKDGAATADGEDRLRGGRSGVWLVCGGKENKGWPVGKNGSGERWGKMERGVYGGLLWVTVSWGRRKVSGGCFWLSGSGRENQRRGGAAASFERDEKLL